MAYEPKVILPISDKAMQKILEISNMAWDDPKMLVCNDSFKEARNQYFYYAAASVKLGRILEIQETISLETGIGGIMDPVHDAEIYVMGELVYKATCNRVSPIRELIARMPPTGPNAQSEGKKRFITKQQLDNILHMAESDALLTTAMKKMRQKTK